MSLDRGREGGREVRKGGREGRESGREGGGGRDDCYTYRTIRRNVTLFVHIIHVIKQMIIVTQQIHCPFHHNI